jgi:membrane protein implicated in regulation of membrane protease activity
MAQNILGFLTAWYNLPYTILIGLGIGMAVLQLLGLSQDSDSDVDGDLDADADMEIDADADADLDADADADIDHNLDADAAPETHLETSSGFSWLAFIGFGKAPVVVVIMILFIGVGMLGWLLNGITLGIFGFFPSLFILFSGLLSLVAGSFLTSRITRFIGRALPPVRTTATKAQALVGMSGKVISPFVDANYGMIHLRDEGGTLISLFAISEDEQPIPRGETVVLISYNAAKRQYLVTRR